MPMSVCQISPLCALSIAGISGFHFIKNGEPFARNMVAKRYVISRWLEAHDLQKNLAPLHVREPGDFFNDLSETHN